MSRGDPAEQVRGRPCRVCRDGQAGDVAGIGRQAGRQAEGGGAGRQGRSGGEGRVGLSLAAQSPRNLGGGKVCVHSSGHAAPCASPKCVFRCGSRRSHVVMVAPTRPELTPRKGPRGSRCGRRHAARAASPQRE